MKKKYCLIFTLIILVSFGCSSNTPSRTSNKELENQKIEASNINNFLENSRSLLESNDTQAVTELVTLLSKSNSVINMEYFPLFQNLQIGTKCISLYNTIVECNPREDNQLWVMDTNGNIVNAADHSILISFNKDNNIIDTFTIETVTTDNTTKRYLKDKNSNTYVAIKNNKLVIDTSTDENSNINNLIQLRDPIWSLVDVKENRKLLLKILNIKHKSISKEFTYTDIENMEQRLITNYASKPYPLLTDLEILIVKTLNNDKKLYLLKDEAQIMVKNYLQAKKQADEIEIFINDNKDNITTNNTQTIQHLLDISSAGTFGIDISKPIYSAFTIAGKCIQENLDSSIYLKSYPCNNSKIQKWVIDPFGRIRNYQAQSKCWEAYPINVSSWSWDYVRYNPCINDKKEQAFKTKKNNDGVHIVGYNSKLKKDIFLEKYYENNNRLDTIVNVLDAKSNNDNQKFINITIDNSSMFWLLTPETRILLADIIETKTSKQ